MHTTGNVVTAVEVTDSILLSLFRVVILIVKFVQEVLLSCYDDSRSLMVVFIVAGAIS